ncbi:MAG: hypothetical protein ACE5H7_12320 [Acidiferrobacterales bacterium]
MAVTPSTTRGILGDELDAACRGIPGDAISVLLAYTPEDYQGAASVGAGSTIVAAPLNCLPEITLHRLHCG